MRRGEPLPLGQPRLRLVHAEPRARAPAGSCRRGRPARRSQRARRRCGSGYFLHRMREYGAGDCHGIDLMESRIAEARERYPHSSGTSAARPSCPSRTARSTWSCSSRASRRSSTTPSGSPRRRRCAGSRPRVGALVRHAAGRQGRTRDADRRNRPGRAAPALRRSGAAPSARSQLRRGAGGGTARPARADGDRGAFDANALSRALARSERAVDLVPDAADRLERPAGGGAARDVLAVEAVVAVERRRSIASRQRLGIAGAARARRRRRPPRGLRRRRSRRPAARNRAPPAPRAACSRSGSRARTTSDGSQGVRDLRRTGPAGEADPLAEAELAREPFRSAVSGPSPISSSVVSGRRATTRANARRSTSRAFTSTCSATLTSVPEGACARSRLDGRSRVSTVFGTTRNRARTP